MRYFGSKVSTLEALYSIISARVPTGSFCDPFGGIGSVGSFFKLKGYNIWSGDVLRFPYYFQIARLRSSKSLFQKLLYELSLNEMTEICQLLNSGKSTDGWFAREYARRRQFFSVDNALRVQSCRMQIKYWAKKGWVDCEEHAILLASLINSMDKVANTAGTYYAFLKNWHRKALNDFKFEFIAPVPADTDAYCFNEDALALVKRQFFDVIYLDPPYNERSYSHYYHLPETIAHEATPRVHGLSGIPDRTSRTSKFNSPKEAKQSLEELLSASSCNLLVFHYADNGIIPKDDVEMILSSYGAVESFYIDSKGYSTKLKSRTTQHHLYMVQNV